MSMQTQAAINPDTLGVSTQTQRIAIGVGQEDFRVAVGRYCVYYRSSAVDEVSLSFTGDHSNYAQTYSFQGCTIETSEQEDAGVARLAATWQSTFAEYIKTISFKNSWYVAAGNDRLPRRPHRRGDPRRSYRVPHHWDSSRLDRSRRRRVLPRTTKAPEVR